MRTPQLQQGDLVEIAETIHGLVLDSNDQDGPILILNIKDVENRVGRLYYLTFLTPNGKIHSVVIDQHQTFWFLERYGNAHQQP